jgi:hypothetical protein
MANVVERNGEAERLEAIAVIERMKPESVVQQRALQLARDALEAYNVCIKGYDYLCECENNLNKKMHDCYMNGFTEGFLKGKQHMISVIMSKLVSGGDANGK